MNFVIKLREMLMNVGNENCLLLSSSHLEAILVFSRLLLTLYCRMIVNFASQQLIMTAFLTCTESCNILVGRSDMFMR